MAARNVPADPAGRLRAAEDALRRVQAQAAALEELSEQLSLSVHVLEAEIVSLHEQLRADAIARADAARADTARVGAARADASPASAPDEPSALPPRSTDAEGARLVALNMALDGESRAQTERYLAEHYDIPDRARLLDDVYAAAGK